jgi:hypothetical protein
MIHALAHILSENRYPLFRDMRQPGLTPQKLSGLVVFARHCSNMSTRPDGRLEARSRR